MIVIYIKHLQVSAEIGIEVLGLEKWLFADKTLTISESVRNRA